ncbi:MAG: methyltransferase domain-containing protein [Vicinamibacterales bacterium]
MSLVLDEHRRYLADVNRIERFRAALNAAVQPGAVVLDLACGTGILGFLACDAGARHVYAVDAGPIIDIARRLARANGYADRITFIRELSTRVVLPERVDLVVCDQIGHLGIEAGAFEFLVDARRFLKPDGRTIPAALTFMVAPIESPELRKQLTFWTSKPANLDVSAGLEIALNTGYPFAVDCERLLAEPRPLSTSPLPPSFLGTIHGEITARVVRAGVLDGICAWFDAELVPGVRMTNAPGHADRIDRRQVLLPIEQPVHVEPGDRVTIRMSMLPPSLVNWQVTVATPRSESRSFSHSTFRGMLMSVEDLTRTNPETCPTLTPAGLARRTVLDLCDGHRSLRTVQDEVYARHPDFFSTHNDASTFVAEVVTRYSIADAPLPNRRSGDR